MNIFIGALLPALVALFLFITHLAEPFSGHRGVVELLLVVPFLVYLSALRARSSI